MVEDKHKQRFGSFIQDLRKKLQKTKKPTNFKKANYKFRLGQKPCKKSRKKNTKDELLKKILHKRKRRKRKKLWIKTFTKKGRLLFKRKWKRYFIWKKRKHRKRIKNLFNFTYFFCKRKQFTPKLSRRWIFFQLRREELPSKVVDKIFEKIKWSVKLRRTFKLKKTLKKCF